MSPQQLTYFQDLLVSRLRDLTKQGDHAVSALAASPIQSAEAVESATLQAERNFRLRIRGRERNLILKIQQALARIEEGNFGICERCGEEISLRRLEVRPVTSHCIHCKNRLEAYERVTEFPN